MTRPHCILAILTCLTAGAGVAQPPTVQTPAPVIYLADNLDEADQLGWCIDTVGRGLADRLHAHSCKPRGGDVQFTFDAASGQIRSATFDNLCMAMNPAGATAQPLGLLPCADDPAMAFELDGNTGRIHPAEAQDLCLTVGADSRRAGPFMSRDLGFAPCEADATAHQTWVHRP